MVLLVNNTCRDKMEHWSSGGGVNGIDKVDGGFGYDF